MFATELAHVEATSNLTSTATTEAGATALLTLPAYTFDGTEVIVIEFSCTSWTLDSTARVAFMPLFLDGSSYGRLWDSRAQVASSFSGSIDTQSERILMSSIGAGSHTWSVRGRLDAAGTFTVHAGSGGSSAAPYEARASIIRVA